MSDDNISTAEDAMTITDERVFFPATVTDETLRARVQLLEGEHIMLDNPFSRAELLAVYQELTERRERERWMEDELASIAETVQPVDDEDTGLRSYMVINIRRIIEVDQEKWLKLMQRVRDRKPLPEPPDA